MLVVYVGRILSVRTDTEQCRRMWPAHLPRQSGLWRGFFHRQFPSPTQPTHSPLGLSNPKAVSKSWSGRVGFRASCPGVWKQGGLLPPTRGRRFRPEESEWETDDTHDPQQDEKRPTAQYDANK